MSCNPKYVHMRLTNPNNMLLCAPTGAGKTNVAMLSIIQCLTNFYQHEVTSRTI